MNNSALTVAMPHHQRLRFSLAGMFIATFGIAVGFACWRSVGGGWQSATHGVLAAFSTWFIFGTLQEIVWRWRLLKSSGLPREVRTGLTVQIAVSLSLMALLIAVIGREVVDHFQIGNVRARFPESWSATQTLVTAGFLLVGVIAYGSSKRLPGEERRGFIRCWQLVGDGLALAAGACVLGLLLTKNMEILSWVWLAIRGVENYGPTRWGGQLFSSREIPDQAFLSQFYLRGCGAAALLALVAVTLPLIVGKSQRSKAARWFVTMAILAGFGCIIWLLNWCYFLGLPRLSPSFAGEVGRQPEVNFLLALVLINAVSLAAATHIASHPVSIPTMEAVPRFLHKGKGVAAVCLLGILTWLIGDTLLYSRFASPMPPTPLWFDWPSWARWLNYVGECTQIHEPAKILSVGALLVLLRWMWRRSSADEQVTDFIAVDTGRFILAWVGTFAILLVTGPVFAWWGFALTLRYLLGQ